MPKPIVVCAADLEHIAEARRILESAFDVRYVDATPADVGRYLPPAAGFFASLHVRLTKELMDLAPGLKAITTPSTGLDHLDLAEAARRGIEVLSLKDDRKLLDRITATAELAWALVLACQRHLPAAVAATRKGQWARDRFRGRQIAYKTFGILGCGRLGTMVSQYARAFRMTVLGNDVADVSLEGVEMVPLDELLARSDVLSIHIHLTEANRRFLSAERIAAMKSGAVLINTSRGAIVDESAVLAALSSGRLAAYGADVIEGEWRDDLDRHELIGYMQDHDNVVITPHVGGVTYESQEMAYTAAAEKLVQYLA